MVAIKWETPTSTWLEDTQNGQFVLASKHGLSAIDWQGRASGRVPDVAQLLGAALPLACRCSSIFPEDFVFCPHCGQALRTASIAPPEMIAPLEADWWGPYNDPQQPLHVPHGLPVTGMPLAGPVESRPAEPEVGVADRRMPRPPNPQAVFAAARFGFASSRLIALAYLRNALQYWDPHAARWHLLTGEKQAAELIFSASEYAWLPASGPGARLGEVALIPTQQGLMRLFINPVSETYHTEAVLKATPASAPGAVGRHIACLIHHNGGMRLWCAQADAEQTHLINCDELNLPTAAGRARFPTMEN